MKLYQVIVATFFILLDIGCRITAQDCSNSTQQLCLSFLSNAGFDIDHIDDDLPIWNETAAMLSSRCTAFDHFSQCMTGVTDYCSSGTQAKYVGWENAYTYMCEKSNLTAVANYLQCYNSANVNQTFLSVCTYLYEAKLKIILNGTNTVPAEKFADYCLLADSFFTCINKTLTTNCGEDAAKWQWSWDRNLNMPILKACPGWNTDEGASPNPTSGWTIALIIILVLITVIMVLAIGFLLFFLLRKRKQRSHLQQMRRRMQTVAPPPPYSAVLYASGEPGAEPQAHLVDSSVALSPGQLGEQADVVHPPTDVVLPPPYMGEQAPAPAYEAVQQVVNEGDKDVGMERSDDRTIDENNAEERGKEET